MSCLNQINGDKGLDQLSHLEHIDHDQLALQCFVGGTLHGDIVPESGNTFPALQYIIRYQVSVFGLCIPTT